MKSKNQFELTHEQNLVLENVKYKLIQILSFYQWFFNHFISKIIQKQ